MKIFALSGGTYSQMPAALRVAARLLERLVWKQFIQGQGLSDKAVKFHQKIWENPSQQTAL